MLPTEIPLNEETKFILGHVCFQCRHIAEGLRDRGDDIPKKAEMEQAHAIHWMLNLYLKHGDQWRNEGLKELEIIHANKVAAAGSKIYE